MAKEGKRKKPSQKKGEKKMGPEAVAMKAKATKADNPFESIWSRRKFDILGKKRKGEERRVGLARSRAVEKRKNTLLKEYEQSLKSSVFVDKRIGEHNDELGEFDKGIIRLQRERQLKLGKKNKYNLSDGEEEDYEGPVIGALSERDDFDNGLLSDDDLKDDDLYDGGSRRNSNILKHINENKPHDPSQKGEEERHKSKKEVMQEIIMKSKLGKMEKSKQKQDNRELMDGLDKSFKSLVENRVIASLTEPEKMNALKALIKGTPKEQGKKDEAPVIQTKEQLDSYDKLIHEMAMDIRARPSERIKTPEEIAQEEREELENLEKERKKRMQATDDLSDEDGENVDGESTQQPRVVSGDDLGDSFSVGEARPKKGWVDEILEGRDDDNSDSEEDDGSDETGSEGDDDDEEEEDEDEQGKVQSLKDWEQSDDDELGAGLEEDDDDEDEDEPDDSDDEEEQVHKKSKKDNVGQHGKGERLSGEIKEILGKEIPFLIDAPKNFEELNALVENRSSADVLVIVNRIRATNAIKLAFENRKKIQVFYGVLLQYFATLANEKPLKFDIINVIVKPLIEMSMEIPYFAAICARQRLLKTRTQFCEAIKNPENGCWPSTKTLFLLKLWSMIFPCSDFRHAVMTPSILLMCEYLMRCPISSGRDIAIGSFLCSMVLLVAKKSQKVCPEAILFLRTLLTAASDKNSAHSQESEFYHYMELKSLSPLLNIEDHVNEIHPLNFLAIMDLPTDSPIFSSDSFRVSVLSCVVETLNGFVEISGGLSSFPEIFMPISALLHKVGGKQEKAPEALKKKFEEVARLIEKKTEEIHMQRQPLAMRKHKPVPIKMVNPKFEENFVKGRDYDPDKQRAEMRKMKKMIKQEAKGAIRELRKDSYFMSEVKAKERAEQEQERSEKYGKARAFLQEQEHAFKSGQLGKGKGKKRRR